jgi:hypothetical protein
VYYATGETPPETPAQSGITGTTAAISGLTINILYYVWVESVNAGGSTMSGAKTVTLKVPAPRNIVVETGNRGITVTWDEETLASSYNVYYSTSQTPPETPAQTGITGTTAAISGLTNGTTYYVWVASVNAGGLALSAPPSVAVLPSYVATSQEFTAAIASINASSEVRTYTIILTNSISAGKVTFTANAEKTIVIKGEGAARTVSNTGTAEFFIVPSGITLSLENNLFLNGNDKGYSVVSVTGGTLVMNAGSKVSNAGSNGIYIGNSGRFTMKGGEISANTFSAYSYSYGGVYVGGGTFTMEGGKISGNTASSSSSSYSGSVDVAGGGGA